MPPFGRPCCASPTAHYPCPPKCACRTMYARAEGDLYLFGCNSVSRAWPSGLRELGGLYVVAASHLTVTVSPCSSYNHNNRHHGRQSSGHQGAYLGEQEGAFPLPQSVGGQRATYRFVCQAWLSSATHKCNVLYLQTQDLKHQIPEPKKGRKFERHSGTGFGHNTHTKRSGKGSYNWGDGKSAVGNRVVS